MLRKYRVIETSVTMASERLKIRRLVRDELPVQTVKLARFLIGTTLVHELPRVRLVGGSSRQRLTSPETRRRTLFAG